MNSTEIRELLDEEQHQRDNIKTQIDEAKRYAAAGEGHSDIDWLLSAEAAYRAKGRNIKRFQNELSAVLKTEKGTSNPQPDQLTFERTFMRAARSILPGKVYDEILHETMRLVPHKGPAPVEMKAA
jgi:hypothetical protein